MRYCVISFKKVLPTVLHAKHKVTDRTYVYVRALKLKVKLTLKQAMKAQRGSRGLALLFL